MEDGIDETLWREVLVLLEQLFRLDTHRLLHLTDSKDHQQFVNKVHFVDQCELY